MTREKAIEFGNMWLEINEDSKNSHTYAFFQMAIQVLQQEPCEDCISRQAVIDKMKKRDEELSCLTVKDVRELPSVTPQVKTGHWIYDDEHSDWFDTTYECSCCKRTIIVPYEAMKEVYKEYPYCHCGAKMTERREK